jgi:hypothetical protein
MLKKLFFPSGGHHPKYASYVSWSFVSNVVISAESAMGTHSMLAAIGSDSESYRTINYIGKDIIGQLGALGYISKISSKADKEPRKFMMYSHGTQQLAFATMFGTPLVSSFFLPVAGFSNILTNVSFAGFGAINAMCIQKLAVDDNVGEIYAKVSMINMIGSSIGLIIGVGITIAVPDHATRICLTPLLAGLRIYSLNRAIVDLID